MPERIRKLPSGKFSVSTPHGIKAKHTTKKKAMAQVRLLRAVDHGWKPTGKRSKHEDLVRAQARRMVIEVMNRARAELEDLPV